MKVWVFVALDVELDRAATMNIIKCVVPISGGKDSQCCVKLALQKFDKSEIRNRKQVNKDDLFDAPCMMCHI